MRSPVVSVFAALVVSLATLASAPLAAAPAPWYRWASLHTDSEICAQVSPGVGWYKALGPFRDSHCAKRGRPGERFSQQPPRAHALIAEGSSMDPNFSQARQATRGTLAQKRGQPGSVTCASVSRQALESRQSRQSRHRFF